MPKNSRCGSRGRRPLADISNGVKMPRTSKKEPPHSDGGGSARDRLLLARADLSKLVNQIDELVTQALEHKCTKEEGEKVERFIHALSDMHSSLKSWIPRLEQAFGSSAVGPGNQLELTLADKTFSAADEEKEDFVSSGPNEQEVGLIVSPSPLVSWRNGTCTVESGRQLFLLTPLHKSTFVAPKFSVTSKCLQGRLNDKHASCDTLGNATFSNAPNSNYSIVVEKANVKSTPNKLLVSGSDATDVASKSDLVSPTEFNCKDSFTYSLSPFVKASPLKTCFLLDSVSDSFPQDKKIIRKGTPWVARAQRNAVSPVSDTLSSGENSHNSANDGISETLVSKYPELFGLQPVQEKTIGRKEVDETLDWFLSPPKTCVLMEPLDEKVLLFSVKDKHPLNSEHYNLKLACPEATPMWKDLESLTGNGKNAGEATLKRELWTKFEAVSANGLQFDRSIFQQISRNRFLDMLEEVS